MKQTKIFICIAAAVLIATAPMAGQTKTKTKTKTNSNANRSDDIGTYVGLIAPLGSYVGNDGAEAMYGITYGHYHSNGIGFRTGFYHVPSVSDIDNSFGIPVAFSYRTGERGTSERLSSAAYGSAYQMVSNPYSGPGGLLASFLASLFSRAEFNIGLTPGYVAGGDSSHHEVSHDSGNYSYWTENHTGLSLSADAGAGLNYRIWRFDLKVAAGFHYLLTKNYVHCTEYGNTLEESPQRWFFTLSGGLSYKF
jgi:hypothetical protein